MEKYKIVIVDDHQLFRNGLKFILNEIKNVQVVGEASNGQEFLDLLEFIVPDLVLMDINMPVMNGVTASKIALEKYPQLNILVLSMYGETEYYNTMIDIGVKGFILKDIDNKELEDSIIKVISGGTYFSQELLLNLIKSKSYNENIVLTKREKEVLELICKGYSNQQISVQLFISQRTVERHRSSLLLKTDSKNSISLVVFAIKHKLISI